MRLRVGTSLSLLILSAAISSCGGSGGAVPARSVTNVVPQASTAPASAAASSKTTTVIPSTSAGGAQSVKITEYSFGSVLSDGGLAIASDGSVWTFSGQSDGAEFVRLKNGTWSLFAIPNAQLNFISDVHPEQMAASGPFVYGEVLGQPLGCTCGFIGFDGAPLAGGNLSLDLVYEYEYPGYCSPSNQNIQISVARNGELLITPDVGFGNNGQPPCNGVQIVTANGSLGTTFSLPGNSTAIAEGPDENIWTGVSESASTGTTNQFDVATFSGTLLHTFSVANAPAGSVAGPDGALWFTVPATNQIGRITTGGIATYYTVPTTTSLANITVGSDGALWFTETSANKVGRITTSGQVSEYAIPTANSQPEEIVGPGGGCAAYTLWFAEAGSGKIAMVQYQ